MKSGHCFKVSLALTAIAMLVLAVPVPAGAASYTITDLGIATGGLASQATGVNNSCQVVVSASYPGEQYNAFYWDSTNGMQDLGTILGDDMADAWGINDSGQVVGYSYTATGSNHAFLWTDADHDGVVDPGEVLQDLGTLGSSSRASDINDSGQVVGVSYTATDSNHAFLWTDADHDGVVDAGETMQDLGTLGGPASYGSSINDSGQVVGRSHTATVSSHAFLWTDADHDGVVDPEETMQDLGTLPGGDRSAAYDINDSGQVVGYSRTAGDSMHAFLWTDADHDGVVDPEETMQDITPDCDWITHARAINNSGQVVGYSLLASGECRDFLWTDADHDGVVDPEETIQDLNDLIDPASGWLLDDAFDINDYGCIVGIGSHDGSAGNAFLMTPNTYTPAGDSVTVQPEDPNTGTNPVTVTFASVSEPGQTTVTSSPTGPPPPSGFKVGASPFYYEVTTTATYSGPVMVCIEYDPTQFSQPEENLHVMHWEDTDSDGEPDAWVEVTCDGGVCSGCPDPNPDMENHIICACVPSLSLFTVFEPVEEAEATVDLRPNTLNLASEGKWVTCYIEVPGCNPEDIDISTVAITSLSLDGAAPATVNIPAAPKPPRIGDYDADGLPDLMVKFSRPAVQAAIGSPAEVAVTVEGTCDSVPFSGTDTIRAIKFCIAEQSVSPGGTVSVNLEFSVPEDCYAVAHGKVKGRNNALEIWRVPIHREAAVSAGTYHWSWDVQVPANARVGSRVKAKVKLKLFDAPGGTRIYKRKLIYKIPVL